MILSTLSVMNVSALHAVIDLPARVYRTALPDCDFFFSSSYLERGSLRPIKTPLAGFTDDTIDSEGIITLLVIFGDGLHRAKLEVEFIVVNIDCAHNIVRSQRTKAARLLQKLPGFRALQHKNNS
ncbi:unnamed protein product [Cuscuta europaea]|uniref:Uncharacterized protein n=1 Tax=Cuscuta europaea TaxID=41803 RepID=A0A9P0YS56_CUSEU|nr:unnamed protein product [Cuscuta europaea]